MLRLCGRPRAEALRGAGVKLLLDENLSDRIISRVADLFPDSTHRFSSKAIVFGHPPKFIWLRVGNCQTGLITNLLRSRYQVIRQFIESETESLLILERPEI